MLTIKIKLTCDICRCLIESIETEDSSEYKFTTNVIRLNNTNRESLTVVSIRRDNIEKDCKPYLHGYDLHICPDCMQKIYSGKQVFEWKDLSFGKVYSFQPGKLEFEEFEL